MRAWSSKDLAQLNWALSQALKPLVPIDRESWQVTRPNLYSWYNPSNELQRAIWKALEEINLSLEGPQFLTLSLRLTRKYLPEWPTLGGYDLRFFVSLS